MKEKYSIKSYIDRAHLEYPVYTIIVKIIIVLAILVLLNRQILSKYKDCLTAFELSSEVIVVLASLLGATVGGLITYLTTTKSILRSNHIKSSLINKKTIYEPLLIELKELRKDVAEKQTIYLCSDPSFRTYGSTLFTVWLRIKSHGRYYQLPDYLRIELLELENELLKYTKKIERIIDDAYDFFIFILGNHGYQLEEKRGHIKSFFHTDKIIRKEADILLKDLLEKKILGIPTVTEDDKGIMNTEFNDYIKTNENISEFEQQKKRLIEILDKNIKLLELIIISIVRKYERQNYIF